MSYLTLAEAADYASRMKGFAVKPSTLLRVGVLGHLLLCAPFGFCRMRNLTTHRDEDFGTGLLVIPPTHLLEIETEGCAQIRVGITLDGKMAYAPHQLRTRDQLRVMVAHLDAFLPSLVNEVAEPANGVGLAAASEAQTTETRQDFRLRAYEDAGCTPPKLHTAQRWNGVGAVAEQLGISRQTLTSDLKAALFRKADRLRAAAALPK